MANITEELDKMKNARYGKDMKSAIYESVKAMNEEATHAGSVADILETKMNDGSLVGPKGLKGDKGDTGTTGSQGIQGLKGDTGLQGTQGAKGDTGAAGPQGEKGDRGNTGIQGVKGDTGLRGEKGLQGEKGDKGDQGIKGEDGVAAVTSLNPGLFGMSVDESSHLIVTHNDNEPVPPLKVDNGHLVYEFGEDAPGIDLGNVMGSQGPIGEQGVKGEKGDIGPAGEQGIQGPQGDTGATGLKGEKGDKGDTGAAGMQGIQGIKGETGIQGTKGADGTSVKILGTKNSVSELPGSAQQGDGYLIAGHLHVWSGAAWTDVGNIQGPAGEQGIRGIKGDTGLKGDKGDTGLTGPQGIQGAKGDKGETGQVGRTPDLSFTVNSAGHLILTIN